MTDRNENTLCRDLCDRASFDVAGLYRSDALGIAVAHNLVKCMIPKHFYLWVLEESVLHDALGAEVAAAVDEGDFAGEVGEEEGLFDSGVAAPNDDDFLSAIKEAVAGGAGRDAKALERLFGGQAEPFGARASGEDHGVGGIGCAAVTCGGEGALCKIQRHDDVRNNFATH